MATGNEKFEYLDGHLPYMLKMVRYDFGKLQQDLHYLDWNAYFESFAVNARNLVQFLGNADTGNMMARQIIPDFRIRKGDIQGPMKKLDDQVFHLGRSRPRDSDKKFDTTHARQVFDWIENGMTEFLAALPEPDRKNWNAAKAVPDNSPPSELPVLETPSASSSIATSSSSSSTSMSFVRRDNKIIFKKMSDEP